jgi:D-glycero-D-manno-heptose 1,7-bisphosphate phosphatase
MKRPAVFFDRDNTLIVSDGYLGDPSKVALVEGAPEIVARMRSLGYAVVVFSNQSGVARGMFTEDDVHRVNNRLDELLLDHNPGAIIDRHEFCPFHPEGTVSEYAVDSDLRKPKPGMIFEAANRLALDLSRSWVIGDAPRDIEAGRAAGCRTIWYKDSRLPPSSAARELMLTVPDAVVSSLREATDVIAREALVRQASAPEVVPADSAQRAESNEEMLNFDEQSASGEAVARVTSASVAAPVAAASAPPRPSPQPAGTSSATALADDDSDEPENSTSSFASTEPVSVARPASAGPRSPASGKAMIKAIAERKAQLAAGKLAEKTAPPPPPPAPAEPGMTSTARLEELAEQILQQLQRPAHAHEPDFSISKLLAGIVQIVAIAILLWGYMIWSTNHDPAPMLLTAVFLQVLTVALLIMGRQR